MNRPHRNNNNHQGSNSSKKNSNNCTKSYENPNTKCQGKPYSNTGSKQGNGQQLYRTSSRDNVKRIVEREGRTARNLLNWSVPASDYTHKHHQDRRFGRSRRQNKSRSGSHAPGEASSDHIIQRKHSDPTSERPQKLGNEYRKTQDIKALLQGSEKEQEEKSSDGSLPNLERETKSAAYQERIRKAIEYSSKDLTTPISRPSSASSIRKDDLRARYWTYLFDNLHRAVDEIYSTCESDENIMECEEVLMMLDGCRRDFLALIDRIKVFRQVENADKNSRPQSVAWEVRKMSPGKCASPPPPMFSGRRSPSPAHRALIFSSLSSAAKPSSSGLTSGLSWADRVRGVTAPPLKAKEVTPSPEAESEPTTPSTDGRPTSGCSKPVVPSPIEEKMIEEDNEDDGWEVVVKGRNRLKGSSFSNNSRSSSISSPSRNVVGNGRSAFDSVDTVQSPKLKVTVEDVSSEKAESATQLSQSKTSIQQLTSKETKTLAAEGKEKSVPQQVLVKGETESTPKSLVKSPTKNGTHIFLDDSIMAQDQKSLSDSTNSGKSPESDDKGSVMSPRTDVVKKLSKDISDDEYHVVLEEDEFASQFEEEQERALASAIKEEEHLTKELEDEALKNTEDEDQEDLSSDRDGTVTEEEGTETLPDTADELDTSLSYPESSKSLTWEDILAQYEQECQEPHDWGDIIENTEPSRQPGRALEMHQKLSSPSRKRPRAESVRISEERMVKAERRRLKLLEDKCHRLRSLSEKVRTVRELKNQLLNQKECLITQKMKNADEKRQLVLQEKVKKAQEEDAKVNEIAFINTLEAQNKKIEVQEKHQVQEARLQDIQEERQRKREEQLAKEEAAQERRRALEAVRKARLEEIRLKRTEQELKWEKERTEREKAREEAVKRKEREREIKLAARNEALQQAAEELQRKIEQKQLESTRRYEQQIEQVKEKAASSSRHSTVEEAPSAIPYERKKKCTLCNTEIVSEVYLISHFRGRKHREVVKDLNKKITDAEMDAFSMKYLREIDEADDAKRKERENRLKAMKKRAKKIRARMALKGREYETTFAASQNSEDSSKKTRLFRSVKDISRLLQAHGSSLWPANKIASLERALRDIERILESKNPADKTIFCQVSGLAVLSRILLLIDTSSEKQGTKPPLPDKIFVLTANIIRSACDNNKDNSLYMLLSNKLGSIADLVMHRMMNIRKGDGELKTNQIQNQIHDILMSDLEHDTLILPSVKTLTIVINMLPFGFSSEPKHDDSRSQNLLQRTSDVISYIVCNGIVDKLHSLIASIQGPLEVTSTVESLSTILKFFEALVTASVRFEAVFNKRKEDQSALLQVLEATELGGIISLTYALLHQGGSTRISPSPIPLGENTVNLMTIILRCLNYIAVLDLNLFQTSIGAEGISLQFRSVASYLLRYCSNQKCDDVLHELILTIGYFTVLNEENQALIQSGRAPTLLQQLCTLPFAYFSDPRLKTILLPTLISCCMNNQENLEIVEQDVSSVLLASFLEDHLSKQEDTFQKNSSTSKLEFRSCLEYRFPRSHWMKAKEYFTPIQQQKN